MSAVLDRLREIDRLVGSALARVKADRGASSAFAAVVEDLAKKSKRALDVLSRNDDPAVAREHVIEVEQAADSAKAAAQADPGASDKSREAVFTAHDALGDLKANL